MSLVGLPPQQQHLNLPAMQRMVMLFGEFHSFLWPRLSPAAQCLVQSIVILSLAIYKTGKYHMKILKSLLKPRAGGFIFVGLFSLYN